MTNVPYPTDTDMAGTLITTEFGGPVKTAGNPQLYDLAPIYPGMYDPDFTPPTDESEGGLALQEQEWVEEIEYLEDVDPDIAFADVGSEVVFANPLDTLGPTADADKLSDSTDTVVVADLPTDVGEDVSGGAYDEVEETAPEESSVAESVSEPVVAEQAESSAPAEEPAAEATTAAVEAPEAPQATETPAEAPVASEDTSGASEEVPAAETVAEGTPELRADATDDTEGA